MVDEQTEAGGSPAGMMLKPSAAPRVNHSSIASATCSGVPGEGEVPAPAAEPPDQLPHGEPFAAGESTTRV